jgi:hypothetical protein
MIYIPDKYKTEELCLEAVKHDYSLIKHVPDKYKTKSFYLEAAKM